MFFTKEESVFSPSRVTATAPSRDITTLFEELYCFLLVAGLFREGEGVEGIHVDMVPISDQQFGIPSGSYNQMLASLIARGLKSRYNAIKSHPNATERELSLLALINRVFDRNRAWTIGLTGTDLFSIALFRQFSAPMATVARYVAAMFGRSSFPEPTSVPKLYLSAFGNIHLSQDDTILLTSPELPCGSVFGNKTEVTPLWAMISAQAEGLSKSPYPGDKLGELLSHLLFMTQASEFEYSIPAPVYAASLYMRKLIGISGYNPVAVSAAFYQDFLYGNSDSKTVSRSNLLTYLLDLMVKKMGTSHFDLFGSNSYYKNLTREQFSGKAPKRPTILNYALESLDSEDDSGEFSAIDRSVDTSTDTSIDANTDTDTDTDPQTDDTGYDPADPDPVTMGTDTSSSMNIIGLISFDKTGEGVDDQLYRDAVVALNDRFRDDDTLPVTAETREALDYWVNGFLYRTAISSTKDYMVALNLQQYLKKFKHEKE